jgi:hypothetical protein
MKNKIQIVQTIRKKMLASRNRIWGYFDAEEETEPSLTTTNDVTLVKERRKFRIKQRLANETKRRKALEALREIYRSNSYPSENALERMRRESK